MALIVCIDTNVFVRHAHLLRKQAGPPLVHSLRGAGGQLFVPDILRREYEEQTLTAVYEHGQKVTASFGRIETLVGYRDDFQLPTAEQVRTSVRNRLAELDPIIVGMPLTDELKIAAGDRVIEKRPPTTKTDHGYKDCLVWESVLRLGGGSDVRLVTLDGVGFIAEGKETLLPELQTEATKRGINVVAYGELEAVLAELQGSGSPAFARERAQVALHGALQSVFAKLINQWQLSFLGPMSEPEFTPFSTENLSRLYVRFRVRLPAGNAVTGGKSYQGDNHVELSGSFDWYPDTGAMTELQVEREALLGSDGSVAGENRTIYPATGVFGGRTEVFHRERRPLK